jgi:dipeptide/tripeptide permease
LQHSGEKVNWHYGFAAAGVGMVLGLIQFKLSRRLLGPAACNEATKTIASRRTRWLDRQHRGWLDCCRIGNGRCAKFNPVAIAHAMTTVIVAIAAYTLAICFSSLVSTKWRKNESL